MNKGTISYENVVTKVKDQELTSINMVKMIIYDGNYEPIKFDDELSIDSKSK